MPRHSIANKSVKARAAKAKAYALRPPKTRRARIQKSTFLKAIKGTYGIKNQIARRMGIGYKTIWVLLQRPDWQDVREAIAREEECMADDAEAAIKRALRDKRDTPTAARTALKVLEMKRFRAREKGSSTHMVIEGGDHPIGLSQVVIPAETLDLPVEARAALLTAIEAARAKQTKGSNGNKA
jgi:hypothetical protein